MNAFRFGDASRQVPTDISPNDRMHVEAERPDGKRLSKTEHYLDVGENALLAIRRAMAAAGKGDPERILDLPCGHGRVLRHLKAAFPEASLAACDVLKDGVDFCAETFGAVPVYSRPDPAEIDLPGTHDLIWCGSLLTHLPAHRWGAFLRLFQDHLASSGLLVFTTHGRQPLSWLAEGKMHGYGLDPEKRHRVLSGYSDTGFGFAPAAKNPDYGFAFSSPSWVCAKLAQATPNLRLTSFAEGGWNGNQDVVGCTLSTTAV